MLARLAIVHLCVFKAFEGIAADSAVNTIFDTMRYNSYTIFSGSSSDDRYSKRGIKMNLQEYKKKRMKDPNFVLEYDALQPELSVIRAIIDARISQNITQKELAERTGIAQTEISRLENGTRNPSIRLLQRLAEGMDMVLNISFTPKEAKSSQ